MKIFQYIALTTSLIGAVGTSAAQAAEPITAENTRQNSSVLPAFGTEVQPGNRDITQIDFRAALAGENPYCNSCNNASCPTCGSGCGRGLFESDHCFDDFVEPVTNPVYFEDPRSRTRLRMLFINQMIPEGSLLQGGDFQLWAAQLSVALNDRLSVIANKDGYITLQSDLLPNTGGWADLATGIKYVFIRDTCNQFLLSGGVLYEWAQGSSDVFQGNGNGVWNMFLTSGTEIGDYHLIGTFGWHLPSNPNQESESLYYSLHLDREITDGLYGLIEMNGIHYTESGTRLPGVTVEGGDLINLGAGDVAGNDFISLAFGGVYKFSESLQLSGAWEFPLTQRKDLFESRTTISLSVIY